MTQHNHSDWLKTFQMQIKIFPMKKAGMTLTADCLSRDPGRLICIMCVLYRQVQMYYGYLIMWQVKQTALEC